MKNLSSRAKVYVIGIILTGLGLIAWSLPTMDWKNPGLYLLAALGALAQTLKVAGPNDRTNYSIAWFVYGFAFIAVSPAAAIFVIVVSHLVEWLWHRYPWFIQGFNIGNHVLSVALAGLAFRILSQNMRLLDLRGALGLALANLVFVLVNHFLVGLVVKLARGQSFAESGVFEFLTLSLDFATLSLGTATALAWAYNPFTALLTGLPIVLLYQALRLPALMRQLKEMKAQNIGMAPGTSGD
jgi:hypothetical protein